MKNKNIPKDKLTAMRQKRETIARGIHNIKATRIRRREIKLTEKELGQSCWILYHTTNRQNLKSILANGIKRPKGGSFVYLSQRPDSWRKKRDGLVTLEINVSGLKGCFTSVFDGLDEILYWGDIPPTHVKGRVKVQFSDSSETSTKGEAK